MIDFLLNLDRSTLALLAIPLVTGIALILLARLFAFLVRRFDDGSRSLNYNDFLQRLRDRKYLDAAKSFFVGELPKADNALGRILAATVIGLVVAFLAWILFQEFG